jgi:hypothetical protein
VLLKPSGKNTFTGVPLSAAPAELTARMGKAQPCIVADFNGDSLVDVIQPFEKGGLIYMGNAGGGFDAPKPCAVCGHRITKAGLVGNAVVGDFSATGHPDILMADDAGLAIFQNLGDGTFEEMLEFSGEVTKANGAATWCGVADFNNDARQDLFVTHGGDGMQIFFNRGFRSFGESPDVEKLDEIPDSGEGQQLGLFVDLRGIGAQDLVVVLKNGDIWWAVNDESALDHALCIRARIGDKSPVAGPVTVSLWKESRCLGSTLAQVGGAAYFGIPDAGSFTLKWTWPGGKEMSKTVTVEKPLDVILE